MGAAFKLTDAIDDSIVKKLKSIGEEAETTAQSYAKLVVQMGQMTGVNPKGLEELQKKAAKYNETAKELKEVQAELNNLRKEQELLLKKVASDMANEAKIAKDLASAKKDEAKAALDVTRAKINEAKQQQLLNKEKEKQKISMKEAVELSKKEVHSIAEAEAANKKLRQAVKDITDAEDRDGKVRQQLNAAINVNTSYIKRNRDALVQARMTVGDYKEQIKLAMVELKNGNNTMKNFGIVAKGFGGVLKSSVAGGFNEVRMGVTNMIKGFVGAQAVISAFSKLVNLFKEGFQSIVNFQAANSKLAAILGTTADNIKELEADAKRLGASTKYTASQAAELQIELAKLGFTRVEILNATESVLKFAQAVDAELGEAASLAGASLRMFNASTSETARYVSAMAIATSRSALSFSSLSTALPIVGPVANSFNFTIEDTLALLGKLADAGFDASMAATATRNIFLNLADTNGKLAKSIGKPVKSLPELVEGLQNLKLKGIDLNEALELTDKRSVAAFNTFLTASEKILPLREAITGVTSDLEKMAETMGNNVQGSLAGLSSAWEAFMLSFMESTGPVKDFIDFFSNGLRNVARDFKSVEQIQEDYNNQAVSMAGKEMIDSDYVSKHTENLKKLYQEYIEAGEDAETAQLKAKEEYLASLQVRLDEENSAYQQAIKHREDLQNELDERGMWETLISWKRTNNVIKDEIDTASKAAAGKKAIASITESLMQQLGEIDLIGKKTESTKDSPNPEEYLKERERLLEIEKQIESERITMMEEGLEKELSKIQLNFTRKIASIKGNSKVEQQLRELLAEQMYRAIIDKEVEFAEKAEHERIEREEKERQNRIDNIDKYAEIEATELVTAQIIANQELEDEYRQGLIDKEEYEREKFELQKHYNEMSLRNAIETAKAMINLMPDGADKDKAIAKLKQQMAELQALMSTDFEMGDKNDEDWASKKWQDKWSEAIDYVSQAFNGVVDIMGGVTDRQVEQLEREMEANEEAGEKELERIQRLAEKGVITTEEAEARKRAAEERTAKKNEELEKKKAQLMTRQAKLEKAANIASVIMNTATAIMKAWGQTGIFGAPMAALIGAMGAIQLATIIAQPIPKYAKGTDSHKGGLAVVGDGGVCETVITDKGMYLTPNTPTLVNLPKGSRVIPYAINIESMKANASDIDGLMAYRKENELPPITIENDYSGLQKDIKRLEESQRKGFKTLAKAINNQDYKRFAASI